MKLIEKKCPNCGASLEFNKDSTSCRCEYCKREFEIERENTDKTSDNPEDYTLKRRKFDIVFSYIIMVAILLIIGIVITTEVRNDINNKGKSVISSYREID